MVQLPFQKSFMPKFCKFDIILMLGFVGLPMTMGGGLFV
jgi:hypothetical protein